MLALDSLAKRLTTAQATVPADFARSPIPGLAENILLLQAAEKRLADLATALPISVTSPNVEGLLAEMERSVSTHLEDYGRLANWRSISADDLRVWIEHGTARLRHILSLITALDAELQVLRDPESEETEFAEIWNQFGPLFKRLADL